jgi:formylglycine-generating enzyme required for sulfatase activity
MDMKRMMTSDLLQIRPHSVKLAKRCVIVCMGLILSSCGGMQVRESGTEMRFVTVSIQPGRSIRLGQHEVRERDLHAWQPKRWPLSDQPACFVSWFEARAYSAWLTDLHRRSGQISSRQRYRLPTDHEWSCAVGIGQLEDAAAAPESKRQKLPDRYPWGTTWPPPAGAGNYLGSEGPKALREHRIAGFSDDHPRIAPVLSYTRPRDALGDLGGNVWEWCENDFRPGTNWKVLRGAAWNCARPETLLSSHRTFDPPNYKSDTVGFRLVLD